MVSCPLLTPLTFLCAATSLRVAQRNGGYGGSVPCVGQLLGRCYALNFTLRDSPRITVRGQTVQGGSVPLRKAPLRSSVYPWSTKRPCGPLAFRRATEGVPGFTGGAKGDKDTIWFPCPLLTPQTFLCADTSKMRSETGVTGSVPCVGSLWGRCNALNFPCVIRRA